MSVTVYIYSHTRLEGGRYALEDSIEEDFEGVAELSGGGSGSTGWNIDLEIGDGANSAAILDSLVIYLRNRKVPRDTYLVIIPPDSDGQVRRRELRVYPEVEGQAAAETPDQSKKDAQQGGDGDAEEAI